MAVGFVVPGVDGVVSYSTAIRLNFLFRLVFGRAGLKFSFNESDSKLPNIHDCRDFSDNFNSCRSSESLSIELLAPSAPPAFVAPSAAGLLELSSVGCGAQAEY